MNPSYIVTESG